MDHHGMDTYFVLCLDNEGYAASLEARKVYRALPDAAASARRLVRVVDESGEDYLYPMALFIRISLPQEAMRAFAPA